MKFQITRPQWLVELNIVIMLKIERATLSKSQSLNEVMNEVSNNTAAMVS